VTGYSIAWTELVSKLQNKWKSVRVSPLIPIIRDDCPGILARELQELASWMVSVYYGNHYGAFMVTPLFSSAGQLLLTSHTRRGREITSLSAPNLSMGSPLITRSFVCSSSRPAVLKSFGNAAITELLAAVISSMHNDLHLCPAPENFLVRGPESLSQKANCTERIVIVGASNMLQTVCHLKNLGWNTVDCTVKGWIASSYGITQLSHMLKGQDLSEKPVMVIDLLSNFVHQYTVPRQCDDTLSLPYRANGKYHLAGDVTVVNDATFKKPLTC
jgi:hypothetical protein